MATLTSQLIVSLVDKVTAPSRAIAASMKRLTAAQARNTARLDMARRQMIDAVGVGYALAKSLAAPIRAATDFETKLEDIAQKIDAPVSALPKLGKQIREVARETTQSASAIADGMDVLTGMGASGSDAIGLLGPIGKAATAYNASIADLSQAGYAALDNLKVPAEQFGRALDAMAQAGKAGAFELKDMARYFPALGAGYQALGQSGVSAVADLSAALQIVRKGTGDSASAATNLSNVLQKMRAPQTVKAFAKMGVNLEKELARAAEAGLTPIEAIAEITNKTLKGDLTRLGYLFSDAQVQQGLRPLLQNMELYRQIRAEAMAAQGVVEEDYRRRLLTGAMAGQRFAIALENINTSIGAALLPTLAQLAETLVPIIDRMAAFAENNPKLTRTVVALTAGLVGLRVAAIAAQFGFLWMKGGVLSAAIAGMSGLSRAVSAASVAFLPLGRAMGVVAPSARSAARAAAAQAAATLSQRQAAYQSALALQGLARQGRVAGLSMAQATANVKSAGAALVAAQGGMKTANAALVATGASAGFVARAFRIMRVALISTGVGALAAGIAAAGIWIYNNWEGIGVAFEAFKGAFMRAVEPIMPALQPVLDGFSWLWDSISGLLGPIDEMNGGWAEAGVAVGKFVGETILAIVGLPGKIAMFAGEMLAAGIALMQSMWDGIVAKFDEMLAWFSSLPGRIIDAIGSIDLSNIIRWPTPPSWWTNRPTWLGGAGDGSPAIAGARAAGGRIAGGRTYLVGEEGAELITPTRSGYVHNAADTAAMARSSTPGTAQQRAAGGVRVERVIGELHVHPSPGMDEQALAEKVARTIEGVVRSALSGVQSDAEWSVA